MPGARGFKAGNLVGSGPDARQSRGNFGFCLSDFGRELRSGGDLAAFPSAELTRVDRARKSS